MSDDKRFGGTYSQGGRPTGAGAASPPPRPSPTPTSGSKTAFSGRKASSFSWRVLGLYLAPTGLLLPGLIGLLTADLPRIGWAMGGYALLMFGAWMTGQGLQAEAAFAARQIARPPAFPRKLFGAAMVTAALILVMFVGVGIDLLPSLFYGALAGGAHVIAFGIDPMKAKGITSDDGADHSHVLDRLEEAEAAVEAAVAAARLLRDPPLQDRIDRLAFAARDILRDIQSDPRDFRRARRFLSVHIVGLRDATRKYVSAKAKGAADMRPEFEALLADLEASFAKQRETLLIDDRVDLEIEIEVLRDRLKEDNLR